MFRRGIEAHFKKIVRSFPAVVLTGARQTGKSTLCKALFGKTHAYVSLEDPDVRRLALEDPRTFLKIHAPPVIIDEIQYAPDLPSYIQGMIDADRRRFGSFILTGSQNFLLMNQVSQSLAGRAAVLTLHPCALSELERDKKNNSSSPNDVANWILRGGFPELCARPRLDRTAWCSSYIRLYLERDVRRIINVSDIDGFERFLRLVALHTGQILNASELGRDLGIAQPTVMRWLSILRASHILHFLNPFHANLSKRLVKSPKIYFADTALASYMMGLNETKTLMGSPQFGALFETAVFLEHIKHDSFSGNTATFSFFRTKDGTEADLMIEEGGHLFAREFKSSRTLTPNHCDNLVKTANMLKRPLNLALLAPVAKRQPFAYGVELRPYWDIAWK